MWEEDQDEKFRERNLLFHSVENNNHGASLLWKICSRRSEKGGGKSSRSFQRIKLMDLLAWIGLK